MALGDVNHVLTNANEGGSSSITYTCVSVSGSTSLYRKTGSESGHNHTISYNSSSGWADVGDGQPRFFGNGVPATAIITPAATVTKLYLINNDWSQVCVLNTSYTSSGSGRTGLSANNSGTATQNMDGSLSFIVSAASNSGESYSISLGGVDKFTITPVGVGPWFKNYTFAEHSAIGYGAWILYDQSGPLDTVTTTAPATPPVVPGGSTQKKVFCNFW